MHDYTSLPANRKARPPRASSCSFHGEHLDETPCAAWIFLADLESTPGGISALAEISKWPESDGVAVLAEVDASVVEEL